MHDYHYFVIHTSELADKEDEVWWLGEIVGGARGVKGAWTCGGFWVGTGRLEFGNETGGTLITTPPDPALLEVLLCSDLRGVTVPDEVLWNAMSTLCMQLGHVVDLINHSSIHLVW